MPSKNVKVTTPPVKLEGMTVNGTKVYFDDGGKELEKYCPKCGLRLPLTSFGLRLIHSKKKGDTLRLQPWCAGCR